MYLARDSPDDENKQPYHTAVNQDGGVKYATGASSKIRGRDNIIRHMEHKESKDAKSCRETPGTNTQNGHIQMEHPWTL